MILDSTFLIDFLLENQAALDISKEIEQDILKTTSVSVFEIIKGIKNKNELDGVNKLFDNLIILNLDRDSAEEAGKIWRELRQSGQEIDPEDCMIAAIAIQNNDTLLARNISHFNRIKKLNLRSY